MASRIKGITVEIGGDTTGLEKALKQVNSTIKNTQSELKDVQRLLKLDPSNTELLSQKQKALKDAIGATSEKLDTLKEAQRQAKEQLENGTLGQDKYDALQREIIETEQELRRLQEEAVTTNATLAKIDEVGGKFEAVGDKISGVGNKVMPINKVIYGGKTLIDLTGDTVTANKILSGYKAHDKAGAAITGTCTFDVNSQDATAAVAEVLSGKTAYVRGDKITGTMPDNGAVTGEISSAGGTYSIPMGFHDGSGKVKIASTEQAKIIPGNIKSGVEVLGVTGTYSGEAITAQSKTATPAVTAQTIQPDTGYDYLSAVTVEKIPYTETDNSAGGKTVTIG